MNESHKHTPEEEQLRQALRDFIKQHRLARGSINLLYRTAMYTYLIATQSGREKLNNPEIRKAIFNKEGRVGLLAGTIFSHDLYFPNNSHTSLFHRSALAGRFMAYDFHRPAEFGPNVLKTSSHIIENGRLMIIPLEEVAKNSWDTYTPTDLLNIFDIEHASYIQPATIEDALQCGFIQETSYQDAFDRVGLFSTFQSELQRTGIMDLNVYQVTPKGNTLIILQKDFGPKEQMFEKKSAPQFILNT